MNDTVDIIDKGFSCLVETLGVVNAESFIAMIKRDSFDYIVWRREYFDNKRLFLMQSSIHIGDMVKGFRIKNPLKP